MREPSTYPFQYQAKIGRRRFPYSGRFKTIREAKEWYKAYGKTLANLFNRKLILTKSITVQV